MEKKKLSKRTKKIVISVVLVVAIVVVACVVAFKPEEKLEVETVKASVQTISETLDTSGTVSAASEDSFVVPSGVKIESINVKEGDVVEEGYVIATFDLSSLDSALKDKRDAYNKAEAAYDNAQITAKQSKAKVSEVKAQIAELEAKIAELHSKTNQSSDKTEVVPQSTVSDAMIQRLIRTAKLFGVEYSQSEAKDLLEKIMSSGSNINDLSAFLDNLSFLGNSNGSFDFAALNGMSGSSELMSAEMSLIQLKAQLATLELQSDSSYVNTFKTVADKAHESYTAAKIQIDLMKNGWIAKSKGIITEVNVLEDGEKESKSASSIDMNSILSAVTSGVDVTSMLTSFMGEGNVAVKVLYYPLVADVSLNKYDVLEVDLDQDVIIKPASGNELAGKVSYISAVATSSNGLDIGSIMGSGNASSVIPAQITIDNPDRSVIVGVDVQVSIITDTVENAVVVPVEVICIDGEDIFVYVLEDGKAVKRNVELGISSDTHYQILSGISDKDILIKNTFGLTEGVNVKTK